MALQTLLKPRNSIEFTPKLAIWVLAIIHGGGILGILINLHDNLLLLTPINLLISFIILLSFHKPLNRSLFLVMQVCFLVGIGIEILGVWTGLVFGTYEYGATLGLKVAGVPLIIGINWAMLIYATSVITNLNKQLSIFIKALIGASLMVALDFLIEPVAVRYDFWHWDNGIIPIQNYIAWFVIAFVLHIFAQKVSLNHVKNPVAIALFIIQVLFFGAMNFII